MASTGENSNATVMGDESRRVVVAPYVHLVEPSRGAGAAQRHVEGRRTRGRNDEALTVVNPQTDFNLELPGETEQFRIIVAPEDAASLDLDVYVRNYMQRIERNLGQELRWAAQIHAARHPYADILIRGIARDGLKVALECVHNLDRSGQKVAPDVSPECSHSLRQIACKLATEMLSN
jgi:hypothetical protein